MFLFFLTPWIAVSDCPSVLVWLPQLFLFSFPPHTTRISFLLWIGSSVNHHYSPVIFFSFQWSAGPPVLSLHPLLVLDLGGWNCASQWHSFLREWECLLSQQIWYSPHLAASLGDPGAKQGHRAARGGNANWSGKDNAIAPARQGSEPQKHTVLKGNTWSPGGRPQASLLGKWQELILFSKLFLFFISS